MALASTVVMEENYLDVEQWIYRTVHDFIAKVIRRSNHTKGVALGNYEGWFEEALSEANMAYMKCQGKYDPARGSYTNWVRRNVWYGLLDWWKAFIAHSERFDEVIHTDEGGERDNSLGWVEDCRTEFEGPFLEMLSEDARFLAQMVIDDVTNPGEWDWLFHNSEWRNETGLPKPVLSARKAVKQRLLDLGWPKKYIQRMWEEVQMVLS